MATPTKEQLADPKFQRMIAEGLRQLQPIPEIDWLKRLKWMAEPNPSLKIPHTIAR